MENRDVSKMLVEKWNPLLEAESGDSKAVTKDSDKAIIAQLLENEENWLNETTTQAGDLGIFTPILVPTVRRIFPALVANQIVGVQPMSGPTGYVFAWRASYAGTEASGAGSSRSVAPKHRGDIENSKQGPQFVSEVWYFAANFAVATNVATGDDIRSAASGGGNLIGNVRYAEQNEGFTKVLIEYVTTGSESGGNLAIAYQSSVSDGVYFERNEISSRTISVIFGNEIGYNTILQNYAGPVVTATGETLGSTGNEMKQIRVHMERATVEAKTRKLKAEYTLEMAQDLKAVHNMDAEAELMNVLQYEIAAEIDRDLLSAINDNATSVTAWSYGDQGLPAGTPVAGQADGQWEMEKYRTLYTKVIKEANRIAVETRRGPGNFIIVSVNVVSALEGLNNFLYSQVPNDVGPVGGVTRVGTLDGRFAVYVDTFSETALDYCTVGYKGSSNMDTGIVFAPYIPLMMQKITHEATFQPAIGVLTRSAIAYNMQGTDKYYRKFDVDFTNSQLE